MQDRVYHHPVFSKADRDDRFITAFLLLVSSLVMILATLCALGVIEV